MVPDATTGAKPAAPPQPVSTPTVGIFDSGIGGFTVAQALTKLRPDLNLVYFGDTLNMPYGGRSPEQLSRFARNSIEFLISEGIDILAVGCNASNSVLGQGELRSFGLPVYDLVGSTLDWLRGQEEQPNPLALVATVATINSGYWQRKLQDALPQLEVVPVAAPMFVPLVEATPLDETAIRAAIHLRLGPLVERGVGWVLHGCTHYPLLQSWMTELYPELQFIDPAACLAEKLTHGLREPEPGTNGKVRLYSSLPNEAFHRIAERVFGRPLREQTKMYIVNPHEE